MRPTPGDGVTRATLSTEEFERFRSLIAERIGIALGAQKLPALQARLIRRLRALDLTSFGEYYDYLVGQAGHGE